MDARLISAPFRGFATGGGRSGAGQRELGVSQTATGPAAPPAEGWPLQTGGKNRSRKETPKKCAAKSMATATRSPAAMPFLADRDAAHGVDQSHPDALAGCGETPAAESPKVGSWRSKRRERKRNEKDTIDSLRGSPNRAANWR